ncbi:hypothetical protein OFN97_03995 [Campylobacter sp. VBCF_05 NA6]|uniref:hypothetical protein n=1 Tax=unclassified Campylobacter TaxID=2593542 RepID=UPI0022E9D22E|nr:MULTISPECIES: hypothetical protein [unclassified Campylobacter]MDA3057248.1 hypothetical protein [Campylobacter sp. VBCF_04 NA7]MDA3059180.1 hypothetical protein [Campylobacter sp. VBCF_05 NA6]
MQINSKRILKFILNVIIGYSPIFYLLIYTIIGALKIKAGTFERDPSGFGVLAFLIPLSAICICVVHLIGMIICKVAKLKNAVADFFQDNCIFSFCCVALFYCILLVMRYFQAG